MHALRIIWKRTRSSTSDLYLSQHSFTALIAGASASAAGAAVCTLCRDCSRLLCEHELVEGGGQPLNRRELPAKKGEQLSVSNLAPLPQALLLYLL